MDELKKPLSFDEQVEKLKIHGMTVYDENFAEHILKEVNYYRFTGYALQFRISEDVSEYVSETTFNQVYRIYLFDEALRDICRKYLEKAEVYYRTQIAYGFSMSKCLNPPHDQHYDVNNYYNKSGFNEVMNNFKREKNYYRDSLIIKHHKSKYNGKLPLWAMVELMSFSNLSKLYSAMYLTEKDIIANSVNTGRKTLENHLHCLAVLRNKCAHAARLYNTKFSPPVRFSTSYLRSHPEVKNDTLFAYLLMLLKRLPDSKCKKAFVSDILNIVTEYQDDADLSLMGFPSNYEQLLLNNAK